MPIFLLLALAACGKKKEAPASQTEPVAPIAMGIAALPAGTRAIIGVSVPRLAGSPLARRLIGEALARDPNARPRVEAVLERCKLDVEKDIDSITIAMGKPDDVALMATGRFDGKSIVQCVRSEVAGTGGTLREEGYAGRVLYGAENGDGKQQVWLTLSGADTVVVATSHNWLNEIVSATEKIGSRAETMALLDRVDKKAAVWGIGFIPPEVGARLVELSSGAVTKPAKAVTFEVDAAEGLDARLRLDMASTEDAGGLARFARQQLDLMAVGAQQFGLGQVVSKTDITSEGGAVKVALQLDAADLRRVEAAFAGQTAQKEQVR